MLEFAAVGSTLAWSLPREVRSAYGLDDGEWDGSHGGGPHGASERGLGRGAGSIRGGRQRGQRSGGVGGAEPRGLVAGRPGGDAGGARACVPRLPGGGGRVRG